jgi:ribosomal protein S18 acetylase RimI-like enzyme
MPEPAPPALAPAPTVRPLRWPDDRPGIESLDTSFVTDRIYRLRRDDLAFALEAATVAPPLRKGYRLDAAAVERLSRMEHVAVAEADGALVGLAAASYATWNRRVPVEHCYVAPGARRRGVGRALMASVVDFARHRGARCVWLETQAENYPAVRFYRRLGFRFCGLDESLYDPRSLPAGAPDTALFFALDLSLPPR